MAAGVNLEDFFRNTFEDSLLVKMPEREDDHLTPATRLLEKRREMTEVEQALTAQKEEFQMKMESLTQRRDELERKEHLLKQSLLKFDRFLKENDTKRVRAIRRAHDERDMRHCNEQQIFDIQMATDELAMQRDKLQEKIRKNTIFKEFMERSLEQSDEFTELKEIIGRYDTLKSTRQKLLKRERNMQEQLKEDRYFLAKYKEAKYNEILNHNNLLADMNARHDDLQITTAKLDNEWSRIQDTTSTKALMVGRIRIAVQNLFELINKQVKQFTKIRNFDTMPQLERIQNFLQDFNHITQDVKRLEAVSQGSNTTTLN